MPAIQSAFDSIASGDAHFAVSLGDARLLAKLLDEGADPHALNHRDEQAPALACRLGRSDCLMVLAERGALSDPQAPSTLSLGLLCLLPHDLHECLAIVLDFGRPLDDDELRLALEWCAPSPGSERGSPDCAKVFEARILRRCLPEATDASRPPRL